MDYDNWKLDTPPSYDFEEGNQCGFCGEPIKDGLDYCSNACYRADISEKT